MNIEQANGIALTEILQKIGFSHIKQKGAEVWYHSPFRAERTASLQVNMIKNVWYDFGAATGGDVVQFARKYLESQNEDSTVIDALRFLRNMTYQPAPSMLLPPEDIKATSPALVIEDVIDIQHKGLIKYLDSRAIPLNVAKKYLQEAVVRNITSGKKFHVLSLTNEGEGYELRNKIFQGCIGTKSVTFIRGASIPVHEVNVFEGFMDFLSAALNEEDYAFKGDVIILNSVSCLPQAIPYIRNYPYQALKTWLDNDTAGVSATQSLKEFAETEGFEFLPQNKTYAPHKDVNAWHVQAKKPSNNQ